MALSTTTTLNIDVKALEKISGIVKTKGTPIIYTQNPPAGTPIPQGMQVQVTTFQPSDVPVRVIYELSPPVVADIALEEIIKLYSEDDFFRDLKGIPTLPTDKREQFVNQVNTKLRGKGLKGEVSLNDATAVFDTINSAGALGINSTFSGVNVNVGGGTGGIGGVNRNVGGVGGTGGLVER